VGNIVGNAVGASVGDKVGNFVGNAVGIIDGNTVRNLDGDAVGIFDRFTVGMFDGDALGTIDGDALGTVVGDTLGDPDGIIVSFLDGNVVGLCEDNTVGVLDVGCIDGDKLGFGVAKGEVSCTVPVGCSEDIAAGLFVGNGAEKSKSGKNDGKLSSLTAKEIGGRDCSNGAAVGKSKKSLKSMRSKGDCWPSTLFPGSVPSPEDGGGNALLTVICGPDD